MGDKRFDLIVVGEINPDLILSGDVDPVFGQVEKLVDQATLSIGSSSAIFACGAARLGLKVGFIGKIGQDEFGRFMKESMEKRGVDTSGIVINPDIPTGLSVILTKGNDRAILTYPGTIPCLRYTDIDPGLIAQARHLHVASYFIQEALRPDIPKLFDLAHQHGLTVSLDTNYDPAEMWDGGLKEALRRIDVFFPNEVECCAIARKLNLFQALDFLAQEIGVVVVKRGEQGAALKSAGQFFEAKAIPVQVVDTVGAGDSFDAGFLYGYLSGWDLERALRLGVICGGLSTRKAGGTTAQATLEEVLDYL